MGKRVFEVAKELGMDHRELMDRCDQFHINVKNYMSVLSDADAARLKTAIEAERKPAATEERVKAPGVVVRRRSEDRPAPAPAAAPRPAAVKPSPTPPAPAPTPARRANPTVPAQTPPAPAAAEARPALVPSEPPAPVAPPVEQAPPPPVVETPPAPVERVVEPPPPVVETPAAPVERAVEPPPAVEPRPAPEPVAERPAPEPVHPVAEPVPAPAAPERPPVERPAQAQRPAPERPGQRPGAEQRPGQRPGADRPVQRPGAERPIQRPGTERPAQRPAVQSRAPEQRVAAEGGAAQARRPEPERPAARAPTAPGEARRPGSSAAAAPGARTRPGAPSEPETPIRAKVLGTIPLDQLRSRTAPRMPARGPQRRDMPRDAGPGGPRRGPPGPRPMIGAGGPPPGPGAAFPPTGRPVEGRRRREQPARPATPDVVDQEQKLKSTGKGAKKRQVFSREELYVPSAAKSRARKRKAPARKGGKTMVTTPAAHKRVVRMEGTISVGELGRELGVKANELIAKLIQMGQMATINQQLDLETAGVLAAEYEYEVQDVSFDEEEVLSGPIEEEALAEDPEAEPRAPVVTIMGHVDHGKTTLLDRIRKANVASGEAGGITQHIGAYRVPVGEQHVVFLDTPGHEAFTAMRARGAQVTDVVVLVVAADDGAMPQTVEAINHAKAAEVPIVVAINKIDKGGADPDRVKHELTKYGLIPEEWGGDTLFVPVSALTGKGVDSLLESLALQTEILELRANPKKPAYGHVVEARVDKGRGPVATVLVQEGTLRRGDYVVAGSQFGRVRAMLDEHGRQLKEAGPSTPVEVLGLDGVPPAGESFHSAANEKDAKKVVESRLDKEKEKEAKSATRQAPADLLAAMTAKKALETLNLIVKTDVQGSLEAVKQAVEPLGTSEVALRIIHSGVGAITESDVMLAEASQAKIIGFNVGPDANAKRIATQSDVEIRNYSVIYELIDAVKGMLSGLLAPEIIENALGKVEVRQVFRISRVGVIAGSYVLEGKVARNAQARILRNGQVVHRGKISGLKRFKDDVREVSSGYECGISVEGYDDIQAGDIVEVFEMKEVRREIG
jgi:translation initiation factor IF-2